MQDNTLSLIARTAPLFERDIAANEAYLSETIRNSRFLAIIYQYIFSALGTP